MFKTIVAALALFCACSDDSEVTCAEVISTWCEAQFSCNAIRTETERREMVEAIDQCVRVAETSGLCETVNTSLDECLSSIESFDWDCSIAPMTLSESYFSHIGPACWGE